MRLCRTTVGSMMSRSKCLEEIPAVIEVNKDQTEIVKSSPTHRCLQMATTRCHIKLFNPPGKRMYQFNALVQAPGDVPMSGYRGSWLIRCGLTDKIPDSDRPVARRRP